MVALRAAIVVAETQNVDMTHHDILYTAGKRAAY